jgi:hypothetical protein
MNLKNANDYKLLQIYRKSTHYQGAFIVLDRFFLDFDVIAQASTRKL